MSEVYDKYKAYAARIEAARGELPTAVEEVTKILEAVRQSDPDISSSPASELFILGADPDSQKTQLVILRWGSRFKRTELDERAYAKALQMQEPTLSGIPSNPTGVTIPDADFKYVVTSIVDDDIPHLTIAGLNDPTRIDAADFLSNPIGTFRRGLYLALRNPVQYSRSTIFSGSHATVRHEGFLCKPDGELVKLGTTGLNFTPAWNVFERENTHKPIQR